MLYITLCDDEPIELSLLENYVREWAQERQHKVNIDFCGSAEQFLFRWEEKLMGDIDGMEGYLNELEQELDRVDTLVKSGNLMADAILNSKLTLARRHGISVTCRAKLPEQIPVEDVELCVILGNLLDNAIEACQQVEEKSRFLRIYLSVNKGRFTRMHLW